jgi:hypothetical protein
LGNGIFEGAGHVRLSDQIIKCLGPILSGENLVTHAPNLNAFSARENKII